MNWKKWLPVALIVAGAVCLIGAIILFVVAGNSAATYKKVLSVICGILMLILSGLIFLYWWLSRDNDPNFFLFDRKTRRNIPVEKLNSAIVNERMTFFLCNICENESQLWSEDVMEQEKNFGYHGAYKPLVAYKMLYDLSEKEPDSNYWDYLKEASPITINSICQTLEKVGETQFVKAFRYYAETEGQEEMLKEFLKKNSRYLRSKMLSYAKEHIEWFY